MPACLVLLLHWCVFRAHWMWWVLDDNEFECCLFFSFTFFSFHNFWFLFICVFNFRTILHWFFLFVYDLFSLLWCYQVVIVLLMNIARILVFYSNRRFIKCQDLKELLNHKKNCMRESIYQKKTISNPIESDVCNRWTLYVNSDIGAVFSWMEFSWSFLVA